MSEFTQIDSPKKFAIIVAIEDYYKGTSQITRVRYAKNDAIRFQQILINNLGYKEDEIILLINQDAVRTAFENDIPYHIKQLNSDYQFIFYYVGHGFYQNGHNKLTCWDSNVFNLTGTCVSIKETLLDPLLESGCKQSLIFLDCCSAVLSEQISSRDVLVNLNGKEFEAFIQPTNYHAVFMSCSPSEKSYSSDLLNHGIWTWHLTEALAGNTPEATIREFYITDSSLQNYLSSAVPRYITKETDIKGTQRPYAKVHASNNFLICKLPGPANIDSSLPDFKFNYQKAIFRRIDHEKIKDAPGFVKGYSLPRFKNSTTVSFVQKIFAPDIEKEIQEVYEKAKEVLKLKKSEFDYNSSSDGGNVVCSFFRYFVEVDLDEDNLSQAKITRKLQIRVSRSKLPADFDSIFRIYLDQLIIPIEGELDFDDLVNKFENLVESQGGSLKDNETKGTLEYIATGKTSITINVHEMELIITHYNPMMRTIDLADKSMEDIKRISSHKIRLLGG